MKNFTYEERQVGVIFGFMRQLLSLSRKFDSPSFVFAWDSQFSFRKKEYPLYKENRKSNKDPNEREEDKNAFRQFDTLRDEILPYIGFKNNFQQKGYEADDLIASVVQLNVGDFVIVSMDTDLLQLLNTRTQIYNIRKKELYGVRDFTKEYNTPVHNWPLVKAIAGCPTDNVEGVPGVGIITAVKYINGELSHSSFSYRNIVTNWDSIVERNKPLVTLPYNGLRVNLANGKDQLSLSNFIDVCTDYGFASFLEHKALQDWREHLFNIK